MKRIILLVLFILLVTNAYGADTKKLYNKTVLSVVSLDVEKSRGGSIGTGFFALEADIIVTCYHVVEGATNITAKTNKGKVISIEGIIDYSEEKDIALLKASSKNASVLEMQANMPSPGTPAYVLGSPKGLDFSFSNGMISQIRRGQETLIQFTCPVSPGNSGGPLLSEDGKVIGIVSCQLTDGQNLNFAVPSAMIYMLNKDNAVTEFQKDTFDNNINSSEDNYTNPNELSPEEAYKNAMTHYDFGCNYLKARLFKDAEKEFLSAIDYMPENLAVLERLSLIYNYEYKQYVKGSFIAEDGIKISIKNGDLRFIGAFYLDLAIINSYCFKNYDKAIDLFLLIIDKYWDKKYWMNRNDTEQAYKAPVVCELFIAYCQKKDYQKAINIFEKYIEYFKDDHTFYNVGLCYYFLNDFKSARNYAEKALKINPSNEEAKRLLDDCKKRSRKRRLF